MFIDKLCLFGGIMSIFGFSGRSVYEELDQDVPYIKWPLTMLEWSAYFIVAYAVISNSNSTTPKVLTLAAIMLLMVTALFNVGNYTYFTAYAIIQFFAFLLLAIGVAWGADSNTWMIALAGALVMISTKTAILPAETEKRLALGPGMSLLVIGWILFAVALQGNTFTSNGVNTYNRPTIMSSPSVTQPQTRTINTPVYMTSSNNVDRMSLDRPKSAITFQLN